MRTIAGKALALLGAIALALGMTFAPAFAALPTE